MAGLRLANAASVEGTRSGLWWSVDSKEGAYRGRGGVVWPRQGCAEIPHQVEDAVLLRELWPQGWP